MYLLYLDESGDTSDVPSRPTGSGSPVFVLGGMAIKHDSLSDLTHRLVEIKSRALQDTSLVHRHDYVGENLPEIKGSQLRKAYRANAAPDLTAFAESSLDEICGLLEDLDATMFAQIGIKVDGQKAPGEELYGRFMERIFDRFQTFLATTRDSGLVVADSRDPGRNSQTAHSIYRKKFRAHADRYPAILETPVFGHSVNHAGIQLADFICSSLLAPMAAIQFTDSLDVNHQGDPGFKRLVERYGTLLQAMQHWNMGDVKNQGFGVGVSDLKGTPLSTKQLFRS